MQHVSWIRSQNRKKDISKLKKGENQIKSKLVMSSNSHVCMYTLSHPILCDYSHQLLCTWDFPGKDTGVDCHFFPQRIFPIQGLNPCLLCLLHLQVGSFTPSTTWEAFMQQKTFHAVLSLTFKAWKPFLLTSRYINLCYY